MSPSSPEKLQKTQRIIDFVLSLILFVWICGLMIPLDPLMPTERTDPSWGWAINIATEKKMEFGRDIYFTVGPYSALYTRYHYPGNDAWLIASGLFLVLVYVINLWHLRTGVRYVFGWLFIFGFVLFGMCWVETRFYALPFLIGLSCLKMLEEKTGARLKKWQVLFLGSSFAALGLLPLIRISYMPICAVTAAICLVLLFAYKQGRAAVISLASISLSNTFFWLLSGQRLEALADYYKSMLPMISGFMPAMSSRGDISEVIIYLLLCLVLAALLLSYSEYSWRRRLLTLLFFTLFMFICFKSGFTRQNLHSWAAFSALMMAAMLLPITVEKLPSLIWSGLTFVLVLFMSIRSIYVPSGHDMYMTEWKRVVFESSEGLAARIRGDRNYFLDRYNEALGEIHQKMLLPVRPGTSDLYPYELGYLLASGNEWVPRPVMQSYSAYTPELAMLNKNHLLGGKAPDNIFFTVGTLDERFPAMDDGASWPVILSQYRIDGVIRPDTPTIPKKYLILKKMPGKVYSDHFKEISVQTAEMGDVVKIPDLDKPVYAKIHIKPSLAGRVLSLFYKPAQINMTIELNTGKRQIYRIVPTMTETGFILSPLIANNDDFEAFFNNRNDESLAKIKGISIEAQPEDAWCAWSWQNTYQLELFEWLD